MDTKKIKVRADLFYRGLQINLEALYKTLDLPGNLIDHFRLNRDRIEKASQEYWKKLNSWKEVLNFKNDHRIDRHKVASISSHYLLKNCPVIETIKNEHTQTSPYALYINEICIFYVSLGRLEIEEQYKTDHVDSNILLKFNHHRKSLTNKSFKEQAELARSFIESTAIEYYQIERLQNQQSDLIS